MVLPCQPKAVARLLLGLGPAFPNTAGAGSSVEHLMQAEHSGGMLCLVLPETHYVGTTCLPLTRFHMLCLNGYSPQNTTID